MDQKKVNSLLSNGYSVEDIMDLASIKLRKWGILLIVSTLFAVILSLCLITISRTYIIPIQIQNTDFKTFTMEFSIDGHHSLPKSENLIFSLQILNPNRNLYINLNKFYVNDQASLIRCSVSDPKQFNAFHNLILPVKSTLIIKEKTSAIYFLYREIRDLNKRR